MSLPINIDALLHGETVEWDRVELKKGWNPKTVLHSICAFANDFNDWDGGYIIIGVEEENGMAKLPPEGIDPQQMDELQKKLIELSYILSPNYLPKSQPYIKDGKHILIIWAHAGDIRPYKAPISLGETRTERAYYIRKGSETVIVKSGSDDERKLLELTARTPFDDRLNQKATIDDLSLPLIQGYLKKVKSKLFDESTQIPFIDLCVQLNIVKGHPEDLRPANIGLLMFNEDPEKYFKSARIDLVLHKDEKGREFIEKSFHGPIDKQLKDVLDYFQTQIIQEQVIKDKSQPEALRFYNYPLEAIEEIMANAVYHKGYDYDNPIEVQIFPNRIEVVSYPGPLPPVNQKMLHKRRIITRNYRNRRIGEFLKELNLTEGKATGFPIIYDSLEVNGSPAPVFETDADSTYFHAIIKIHPLANKKPLSTDALTKDMTKDATQDMTKDANNDVIKDANSVLADDMTKDTTKDMTKDMTKDKSGNIRSLPDIDAYLRFIDAQKWNIDRETIMGSIDEDTLKVILFCTSPKTRQELFDHLNLYNNSRSYRRHIQPLIDLGWILMTEPDNLTSRKQKYYTSRIAQMLII